MGIRVAEYFGQRTDIDNPVIQPAPANGICPFMNSECPKIKKHQQPFCSIRKSDNSIWISCPHRLCSTLKGIPLSQYQVNTLHNIARTIFSPDISLQQVCVKREQRLTASAQSDYNADYILAYVNGNSPYPGPNRLVLEMQGGGETSNTKKITSHVSNWARNPDRTNSILRADIKGVGTIETNAWRRQQEQFIVKGNIAMKTWKGYGMCFCVGSPLYNYLMGKITGIVLPDLRNYNWNLAILAIIEDTSNPITAGPIPLKIDNGRLLFTNYQTFVQALINQGEPSLPAFTGTFLKLDGNTVELNNP